MVRITVQNDNLALFTQQFICHGGAFGHQAAFLLCHGGQ